jgi:hypothetical protein
VEGRAGKDEEGAPWVEDGGEDLAEVERRPLPLREKSCRILPMDQGRCRVVLVVIGVVCCAMNGKRSVLDDLLRRFDVGFLERWDVLIGARRGSEDAFFGGGAVTRGWCGRVDDRWGQWGSGAFLAPNISELPRFWSSVAFSVGSDGSLASAIR